MKFSDKLAKMRKANNLSQEQLADQLGVTRQSVSKWESGESYPDMAKIIQICKILNCKLNDIMEDGLIAEETETKKEEKPFEKDVNIAKGWLNSFLNYVTKTYNMLIHMSFKSLVKLVIEMAFLAILCRIIAGGVQAGVQDVVRRLLSVIPKETVAHYIYTIITTITLVAEMLLAVVVFLHIFKIRYLDYYVTLTDENASIQTVEKPIEDNVSELKKDSEPKVVIRDPKHSGSAFLDGIVNVVVFLLKVILVMIAVPLLIAIVCGIGAIFFCLFNGGTLIKFFSIVIVGAVVFGLMIVYIIFNIIFNHKQPYLILVLMLVSSLLLCGMGGGAFASKLSKINIISNYDDYEKEKIKYIIPNLKEGDILYIDGQSVEYVIDDTKEETIIEFEYPKGGEVTEHRFTNESGNVEYYYHLINNINEFQILINDISKDQIHNSYNPWDMLKAKVTCNSKNRELLNNLSY